MSEAQGRRRHRLRAAAEGLALALALVASLSAQRQSRPQSGVQLRRISGELRLDGEVRDETSTSSTGTINDESEWLTRESVGLRLSGDIFDRRLIDFDMNLSLGFEQRRTKASSGQRRSSDNWNFLYNLRALFLSENSVNAEVYMWRTRIETRERFFQTSRADIEEIGVNLRLEDLFIPSQIHYDELRQTGEGVNTMREHRRRLRVDGSRHERLLSLNYDFAQNDVDLKSFSTAYQEVIAHADGVFRWGAEGQDFLRTSGYVREQTGDVNTEFTRGSGNLHFQWLDSLYSEHGVVVDQSEINGATGFSQDRREVNTSIHHRLYESLSTRLGADLIETDLGDQKIDRIHFGGDLSYRKKTPFGAIGFSHQLDTSKQDESGSGQQTLVVDEAHTVTPGVPIVLSNPVVDLSTILVTDPTGGTVYFALFDYVVTLVGDRIHLGIPVGSKIPTASTIFVDYAFKAVPARQFRSERHTSQAFFEFQDYAVLNLGYSDDRQTLLSGSDNGILGSSRRRSAALRLFQWDQEVGFDYEDLDSTFTPYERYQIVVSLRREFTSDLNAVAQAMMYRTRFKESLSKERGLRISTMWDWRLGQRSSLHFRGEYHSIDNEIDRGDGVLLETRFNFRLNKTHLSVVTRFVEEEFEQATDQRLFHAMITFKRTF